MITKKKAKEIVKFFGNPVIENRSNKQVRRNAYYLECVRHLKVKNNTVLLESYHGVNFTGNAYAIFRYLVENHPNLKCFIAVSNLEDPMIKWINANYKDGNFTVIEYASKHYLKALATCKYLVNDTSYMPYFIKRDQQVYLNTWHGTPLKTLGTDIKNASIAGHQNIQKNLFSADKLAMPNRFTADKLVQSNDLDGIINAEVLITGNPRVDLTLNSEPLAIREKYSLIKGKKIVLFAPTWKKNENETTDLDIKAMIEQTKAIQDALGDTYHVYLKTHYFIYKKMLNLSFENHLIPNWVDSNELLAAVDTLITDYSSIFFDFLPLKRPIHFYMEDLEEYVEERGLYLDIAGLPGQVSRNLEQLVENIKTNSTEYLQNYQANITNYLERFCYEDHGFSAKRTVGFLLGRNKGEPLYKSHKKVVVFYGGGFYNNGITSSIINLSKKFDYDKYECVVIENSGFTKERTDNIKRLDHRVHLISKFSYTNRNVFDTIAQNLLYRQGYESKFINKKHLKKFFELNYKRVFGLIHPDVMIDYGGYNKAMCALFAFAPVKTKAIFLHTDINEEYNKVINGQYKHKWNLKVIFSLYDEFDKIISVTDSVNEANKKTLKDRVTHIDEKMISISNIIDGDSIIQAAQASQDSAHYVNITANHEKADYLMYKANPISQYNLELGCIRVPDKTGKNFVSVARLSPEKNQESLIRAFKGVVEKDPQCKLYILGNGPLFNHLDRLIKRLNLDAHVFLMGHVQNPFAFVSLCDCFILTSNYEGQGMSILEARVIGKPVIGTNVNGISSILNNQNGLLIENNIESIEQAMLKFLKEGIPTQNFDYEAYNAKIIKKLDDEVIENR